MVPHAAGLPPLGVDPKRSDCVIRTKSGSLYYTFSGSLAACSPVFRDLVECCEQNPLSGDIAEDIGSPSAKRQRYSTSNLLEIPLDDPDQEVEALVEHLHQPDRFLLAVVPTVTKEGAVRIAHLTPIASKYDMQGNTLFLSCHIVWHRCIVQSQYPVCPL